MSEYILRKDEENKYTLSKWEDGALPVIVYTIERTWSGKLTCTCPSGEYRKRCKHTGWPQILDRTGKDFIFIKG